MEYGWCGASRERERLRPLAGRADALVDAILCAEGFDPAAAGDDDRTLLTERVEDWLVRDSGRGARSELP
jgi:hypothetical protein